MWESHAALEGAGEGSPLSGAGRPGPWDWECWRNWKKRLCQTQAGLASTKAEGFVQALLGCKVRFQWDLGVLWYTWLRGWPWGSVGSIGRISTIMGSCQVSQGQKGRLAGRDERTGSRISKFAVWDLGVFLLPSISLGVHNSGCGHPKVSGGKGPQHGGGCGSGWAV